MVIYLITNSVNGKKYVGQTVNEPTIRWGQHVNNSGRGSSIYIHRAMRKYGIENFCFEVIDESADNNNELNDLEEFYVSLYDTFKGVGYNCTSGGDSCVVSEETKLKISKAHKGKKLSEEHKEKTRQANLGKKLSEEHKKKISESHLGEKNHFYGKRHSEEAKLKNAIASKKRNGILNKKSKKVIQIDKVTGEEIAIYFNSRCAADLINKANNNHIRSVCVGDRKTAGGFIWRYLNVSI